MPARVREAADYTSLKLGRCCRNKGRRNHLSSVCEGHSGDHNAGSEGARLDKRKAAGPRRRSCDQRVRPKLLPSSIDGLFEHPAKPETKLR